MFNNKGGVGKTTLTCNISAYLAEMGYKVLVVDADPQCNSTINLFPEDVFETMYYKKEGYTIHDVVKSVQRGKDM
jgi:cellulose biosynthesis protein BcsQ